MSEQMLPVGTYLRNGAYLITSTLSSGGFGNTYVVRNTIFNETYAMKEFFMKGINIRQGNDVIVSQRDNEEVFLSQKAKFQKEALRLRQLSSPGIVKIHDFFEENGTSYYVMDFIEGHSLAGVKTMPEQQAQHVLSGVLEVLALVHREGFTHMDIKPANIMVDNNGQIFLIDFGASKQLTSNERNTLTTDTAMPYTKGYAPIEQVNEEFENICPATDIYALGATYYRLLTGNMPPSSSQIVEQGREAFSFPPDVSDAAQQLVRWMMQPSMKKRPQTVDVIRDYLSRQSGNTQLHRKTEKDKDTSGKRKKQQTMIILALSLILILAVALGLVLSNKTAEAPVTDERESYEDVEEEAKEYAEPEEDAETDEQTLYFNVGKASFSMTLVEGGSFWMGASSEQQEYAKEEEYPVHKVTLGSYYIAETEVTQGLWEEVMGSNPSSKVGRSLPVENVSYEDCQLFVQLLSKETGHNFRLPTEAEWEYAARGGTNSRQYVYAGSDNAEEVGWIKGNCNSTQPVATKKANELGLYDMTGNVCEWCQDWYATYNETEEYNPQGPSSGTARVGKGGGWCNSAARNRVSCRNSGAPSYKDYNLGLRLACDYDYR
ncbi:MAG: SUMF1/EgtB/PvdO family nonheme iron enzyme [Prevotella sp.]|nr:SUMF1/EgtB/PvdO family nonheme iron enzyme [Prevotella sp.]